MFYENVGTPIRSSTKYFVIFSLLLLVVGMGYSYVYRKNHAPPERATPSQQTQQQIVPARQSLTMAASGNTIRMRGAEGNIVKWYGTGFTSHCVYTDGRTETHDENGKCGPGELDYQYAHDTTGKSNSVEFEFIRR